MPEYDPASLKADEFINHEEILATLDFADKNKDNIPLIEEILEKARPVKSGTGCTCRGLSHREASVLLACEDPRIREKIYDIADEIKQAF
jgi:2-iminoacetate synthase